MKMRETNLVDMSKITLENYATYNEKIMLEVTRQFEGRNIKTKKEKKTLEELKEHLKEYQHNYYLKVTKPKRNKLKKNMKIQNY